MKQNRTRRLRAGRKTGLLKRTKKDSTETSSYYNGLYSGMINPISGAGTSLDKNSQSFYIPTRNISKNSHETIYVESWAAAKFIDIPVDDMFVQWREFCDMENESVERMEKAEIDFKIKSKLSNAMKSGRLYGTGLFIILTKDSSPEKPLNINRMLPGDLANILTVDRFDASVVSKNNNPYSQNYGKPNYYRITLKRGGAFVVHYSRVIRFDGIRPMTANSWQGYDEDWGVASIIPVLTEIFQDSNVSKGVAHLVNEASIKNMKVDGFEEALSGGGDGEMSLQERMELTTQLTSIYRTNFMDVEDDFGRTDVTFSQLPEIMDRNAGRLAAAADIPKTRFWSESVSGLQATGEGDARNYALKVNSDQENKLPEPLEKIDRVLAAHIGLTEPVCYKFISILDISESDKVDIALKKAQTVVPLVAAAIIDEDEARSVLDGDEIIGDFDDLPGGFPKADEFKKNLAAIQVQKQQSEGFGNG